MVDRFRNRSVRGIDLDKGFGGGLHPATSVKTASLEMPSLAENAVNRSSSLKGWRATSHHWIRNYQILAMAECLTIPNIPKIPFDASSIRQTSLRCRAM